MSTPTAPTSSLPPLGRLLSTPTRQISTGLANLRSLYFSSPPLPLPKNITIPKRNIPKHLIHGSSSVPDSGYASADDDDDSNNICLEENFVSSTLETWVELEQHDDAHDKIKLLRADPFERAFAIKWVTGFISRCDVWMELADEEEEELAVGWDGDGAATRAKIVETATTILSLFSTDAEKEEFAVTRTFSFLLTPKDDQQKDEHQVVKVELNDAPLSSHDHTSVGLQSWASSILLSERMTASPSSFSLCRSSSINHGRPMRILELGAGTGLLSIVAAKMLEGVESTPIIVATDYHPGVLENLEKNVQNNFPRTSDCFESTYPIHVKCLDWENPRYDAPLDERFDVILAADVIYHPDHACRIKNCIEKLLQVPSQRGPDGTMGGVFWMMVAIRSTGRHEGLHTSVGALFPDVASHIYGCKSELVVLEKELVNKRDGVGRADEGGYLLFKIGWRH